MTRKEKHKTVLDLCADFIADGCQPLIVAGVTLGRAELLEAIRWVRGHDELMGAPEAAPAWWAQVIYELRAERREDREERLSAASGGRET